MIPRLSYYGPVEKKPNLRTMWKQVAMLNRTMKGEKMLKIGDKVKMGSRVGVIKRQCPFHEDDHHWIVGGTPVNEQCYHESDLIPVEPERDEPVECSLARAGCSVNRLHSEISGRHFCHARKTPCPHTYAQRAGMLERGKADKGWFVVSCDGDYANYCLSSHLGMARFTEEEARAEVKRCEGIGLKSRMFRWSDGKGE